MRGELDTRALPYEAIEGSYANNRAPTDRPPIPKPGDRLLYRRYHFDQDPIPVVVVWAQDPDDTSLVHVDPRAGRVRDPNLWHLVKDPYGYPIADGDDWAYARHPDPWPQVRVRGTWADSPGMEPFEREAITREARMRGSSGWLPLGWRGRPLRMVGTILLVPVAPAYQRFLLEKAARQAGGG